MSFLADIVRTAAAVLIKSPDVRLQALNQRSQRRYVGPVHGAYHSGELQARARDPSYELGGAQHFIKVSLWSTHRTVHGIVRAIDRQPYSREGKPEALV